MIATSCFRYSLNAFYSILGFKNKNSMKYYLRQWLVALIPIISTVSTGMTMGYSAMLLPQLRAFNWATSRSNRNQSLSLDTNDLTITSTDEESWIAAAAIIAMAPGCWLACLLMNKFGRKITVVVTNPIFILGWTTLSFASQQNPLIPLIVGRLFCGFAAGLLSATGPVYIAETSHPRLRGLLLAGLSLAVTVGILISHVLGTWLHWRLTAYLCSTVSILSFFLSFFMPETPNWLVQNGNPKSALEMWIFLHGKKSTDEFENIRRNAGETWSKIELIENGETLRECGQIAESLEKTKSSQIVLQEDGRNSERVSKKVESKEVDRTLVDLGADYKDLKGSKSQTKVPDGSKDLSEFRQRYLSSSFIKPLIIICVFAFTSQFSGVNVVTFYCVTMFVEVSGPENAYLATLILDVVRVAFSIVACWITTTYSRRLIARVSGFGTALTLFALSSCLLADYGKPWLPIVLLFIYTCTVTLGLVPLPWLLCGELFTNSITRAFGSGLCASFSFLCFFTVVKTGPIVMEMVKPQGVFVIYGAIVLLGSVFLSIWLPETKDKTHEEISSKLSNQPATK